MTFITLMIALIFTDHYVLCLNDNSGDQSMNEIVEEKLKPELVKVHHYYLPQQTVFGSPGAPAAFDASKTAPPHITIMPTTTLKNLEQESTESVDESINSDDHIVPYSSYCMSETPARAKEESELLKPSKELLQNVVVLSGYEETPSKTSDNHQLSDASNYVSISSNLAQESQIFTGNTSSDI